MIKKILFLLFFFFNLEKKIMKRPAQQMLEKSFDCTKTISNNENLILNNQNKVIELDDDNDDDLEMLDSCYPSTKYEISSFDKIIKNEENSSNTPKTYKVTINMRNPYEQAKFRNELLSHYKKCIITGTSWDLGLEAAHIMPFKQVGSHLSTGILLRKDIHSFWDRFHISIDPQTWTIVLSERGCSFDDYSKYNNFELPDKTVILLKKANIEILGQHYHKFKEMEYSRKYKIPNFTNIPKKKSNKKSKNQKDDYNEIIKRFLIMVTNEEFFSAIEKSLENPDDPDNDEEILEKFKQVNKKDICIIKIVLQYLFTVGLRKFNDDRILEKENVINNIKNNTLRYIYQNRLNSYRSKIPELKNIASRNRIWAEGEFDIKSGNFFLALVGLKFTETSKNSGNFCLFRISFINDNLEFQIDNHNNNNNKKWKKLGKTKCKSSSI
jgi:hypothetical protein